MSEPKTIYLIGGMPTSGKSTIAQGLSDYLHTPWISTDQIREVMRVIADRNQHPKLFMPEGYTAERFLTEYDAQQIVNIEFEQGEATWPGVSKLIVNNNTWHQGFVIEGVAILPHLIERDYRDNPNVKPVFIGDENEDRVRNVVYTRGLWGDAKTYSDDVKEREVEWAISFSKILKQEAEKNGYPWVEVEKNADDLNKVLQALGLK